MTTFKLTTRQISSNLIQIACCNIQSSPITKVSLPSLFLSNTVSLVNKIEDLEIVIKNNNADIVCITETWPSANIEDSVVDISVYTIVRKDRVMHKRGGGVCAFINLPSVLKLLKNWTTLYLNVFGCIFAHPDSHVVFRA